MTDEEFLRHVAKSELMSTCWKARLRNIAHGMELLKKKLHSDDCTYTSTKTIKPEAEKVKSEPEVEAEPGRVVVPAEVFMKKYKDKMKEN
jgi:hypothetical protein